MMNELNKMNKKLLAASMSAILTGVLSSGLAYAEFKPVNKSLDVADTSTAADKTGKDNDADNTLEKLKKRLKAIFRSEPDQISESKIPTLYQVMYGTEVVYVSADGKYFIAGDMINLDTRENETEIAKRSIRKDLLNKQDNKPVVFKAKDEKQVLTVFTDIDCPYCAKLHREVPELNENGITVKYLMFPRAGIGSQSFKKAVNMWCADDQQQAMTDAKARKPIPDKNCDNPIKAQYQLGQELGVTGTPALITSSGKLIPGYVPADRLKAMLDKDSAEK